MPTTFQFWASKTNGALELIGRRPVFESLPLLWNPDLPGAVIVNLITVSRDFLFDQAKRGSLVNKNKPL